MKNIGISPKKPYRLIAGFDPTMGQMTEMF